MSSTLQEAADSRLRDAARVGSRALVLAALAKGGRPSESCAAHAACKSSNAEILRELRWAGGLDPNYLDEHGDAAIICAAREGNAQCAKMLLDWGADPGVAGSAGLTALHAAARRGSAECARALLEAGANPRAQCERGEHPIHCAARSKSWKAANELLAFGADPWAKNERGRSAIGMAIAVGEAGAAKEMAMSGGPGNAGRGSELHWLAAVPERMEEIMRSAKPHESLWRDGRGLTPAELCRNVLGEDHQAARALAAWAEREEIAGGASGGRERRGHRRGAL